MEIRAAIGPEIVVDSVSGDFRVRFCAAIGETEEKVRVSAIAPEEPDAVPEPAQTPEPTRTPEPKEPGE